MMAPLLRMLASLHARHILHRDIKPENIFLTQALAFKLGDLVWTTATDALGHIAALWSPELVLCQYVVAPACMPPGH